MNILLVYPEFPDTFWSFKHALRFIRKRANLPPLGLLTVAAMLPRAWNVRLVDLNVRRLSARDIQWADYVMISAMIVQRPAVEMVIGRCRAAGRKLICGGPLFTAAPEDFPQVEHLILNEAEITLPLFLADLAAGRAQRVYTSTEYADIGSSPTPRWELADLGRYASMALQYSRGCPFNCEFCNVTSLFGHRPRVKSPAQVIAELDALRAAGYQGQVFFVDDNFIGNKHLLKTELLPALIQWRAGKRPMAFNTEASINLADDPELMRLMVAAGFDAVFVGIETPDEAGLAECNKKQNKGRDLVANVQKIQQSGLQVQAGFIVGFDSDTPSIFQRQIEFIQQSGIVTAMVGMLQAPPGTQLYKRMQAEGRLVGHTTGDNADGTSNIITKMSPETLRAGYQKILKHIYSPGPYYARVRTFLRHYNPPKVNVPLSWANLHAFVSSTYRLGFFGRERVQYWRLLAWTLLRRPRHLPVAVTLAIYGYHFRKVSQLQGI